jgi:hypothetical protein
MAEFSQFTSDLVNGVNNEVVKTEIKTSKKVLGKFLVLTMKQPTSKIYKGNRRKDFKSSGR